MHVDHFLKGRKSLSSDFLVHYKVKEMKSDIIHKHSHTPAENAYMQVKCLSELRYM